MNVEYTDDPHPRNTYWEMWGQPMFDLADPAARDVRARRVPQGVRQLLHPRLGLRRSPGWESLRLSFIVNRPGGGAGLRARAPRDAGRNVQYTLRPYATAGRWAIATEFSPSLPMNSGRRAPARRPALFSRRRHASCRDQRSRDQDRPAQGVRGVRRPRGAEPARPRAGRSRAGQDAHPRDRRPAAGRQAAPGPWA